jgi:EAL domain-containing protein (putative c-di-GMP-specific phosphodiesterase class I)
VTRSVAAEGAATTSSEDDALLQSILSDHLITTVYQPIRSLADGSLFGYEALSRGPAGTSLAFPDALFDVAERHGRLFELERLCRETALKRAIAFHPDLKLFLNIDPRVVNQPGFHPGVTRQLLESTGRSETSVVLEITERDAITDYAGFRQALQHYARQGFSVAVDDVGSGYSSLVAIVELAPEFLKIDLSLVRGIATNHTKQVLVEAVTTVASRLGLRTVAEGVETLDELRTVTDLGVDYGQGFFLGRPTATPGQAPFRWPL